MEIIKKTVTTEVVDRVVSCDGKYARKVGASCTLEQAERIISEYEDKLSTVLWQRMIDRGLLREIKSYSNIPSNSMTPEQKHDRFLYNVIDQINDAGCSNYSYYIFKPDTEQDIIDLLTYVKADDKVEELYFPKEEYKDEALTCTRKDLVPGQKYIYCVHCDGYNHLFRLDEFRVKINKVIENLEEL